MSVNDAPWLGVSPEHSAGLVALLLLPAALWLFFKVVRFACGQGVAPAVRFVEGYYHASLSGRLTALLLLISGTVHLALAFGHGEELAGPFLLDGGLLVGFSYAVFVTRGWRPVVAVLLMANLLAYTVIIGRREEQFDHLGMTTKLVELLALALALSPLGLGVRHRMLSWMGMVAPVFGLGIILGGTTWTTMITHVDAADGAHVHADGAVHDHGHVHDLRDAIAGRPAVDQAYVERLLAETRAATARYADINVALAEGYKVNFTRDSDTPHLENPRYKDDDRLLDPEHPENLVYLNTRSGPMLVGVLYLMPRAGDRGPSIGVPGAEWHTHTLCLSPLPMFIVGILPPTGMCPAGAVNVVTPEMMHVWLVDNPAGPFADHLDDAYRAELQRR